MLVKHALELCDRITMKQAVSLFRGSNARMSNDLDPSNIEEHGVGKEYQLGDAERLFETLLIEQAFEETYVANGGGFSNAYLKVSLDLRCLLPISGADCRLYLCSQLGSKHHQYLKKNGKTLSVSISYYPCPSCASERTH